MDTNICPKTVARGQAPGNDLAVELTRSGFAVVLGYGVTCTVRWKRKAEPPGRVSEPLSSRCRLRIGMHPVRLALTYKCLMRVLDASAFDQVGEARHTSPYDSRAGRGISRTVKIAAEPCDSSDVEGEVAGSIRLTWGFERSSIFFSVSVETAAGEVFGASRVIIVSPDTGRATAQYKVVQL